MCEGMLGELRLLVALKASISAGETPFQDTNEFWCLSVCCFIESVELYGTVPCYFWTKSNKALIKCGIVLLYVILLTF